MKIISARQLEVALCVADGLSNREIAKKLHLSLPTVKSHIKVVMNKLGVHTRIEVGNIISNHNKEV